MEKYNGNQKGFIYVSCDTKDKDKIITNYLEPLAKDGVSFYWADGFDRKEEKNLVRASAALIFLTNDYVKKSKLRDTVIASVKNNKPVLCVYLEDVELDAALSMQTEAQQALFVSKYNSDEEFIEELKKAAIFDNIQRTKKQKNIQRNRTLAAVAVAAAVLIAAIIIVKPMLGSDVNEDTMRALGLLGVSEEALEKIEEIHIVGNEIVDYELTFTRYDEDETTIAYSTESGTETTMPGTISDLSGIERLKNLRVLQIEGQQIEDITPLLKLENLEVLSLTCNPISSVDGIGKLKNLQRLDIDCTNVSELPDDLHVQNLLAWNAPLTSVPNFGGLSNVYFDSFNTKITDFSNLNTAESYESLTIQGDNIEFTEITEPLKGIPIRDLGIARMDIDSLEDLSDLTVTDNLDLRDSSIRSLEGIEHFEGITCLGLTYCNGLTDLSAVNKLNSLVVLYISEDMAYLADAVDDSIRVNIE